MTKHSIPQPQFDPIAFEAKHQADYERSLAQDKFSQQYQDDSRTTFADGKWDAKLNFEPESYQWLASAYRKGYLAGVAERLDEKFAG